MCSCVRDHGRTPAEEAELVCEHQLEHARDVGAVVLDGGFEDAWWVVGESGGAVSQYTLRINRPMQSIHIYVSPGSAKVVLSDVNARGSGVRPGDQSRHSLRRPEYEAARNQSSGRRGSWKKSMYQEL